MTKQSIPVALGTSLPQPTAFYTAFFNMVAEHGLAQTTLSRLAAQHHWQLLPLRQAYPTSGHILAGFSDYISDTMQDAVVPDSDALPRDSLFELVMARLDALQPYQAGFIRLLHDLPTRPDLALILLRQSGQALSGMIDTAGWDGKMWQRPLYQAALSIAYMRLLHVWQNDKTADLSKSMAFLDDQLDRLEARFGTGYTSATA